MLKEWSWVGTCTNGISKMSSKKVRVSVRGDLDDVEGMRGVVRRRV